NDINKEEITTIDKDNIKEHTPLVTLDNDLDYIVNHDNRDFINKLPLIQFPYTQSKKSRAFQINGSEMEYEHCGLHHKDILLCSPVSDYENLHIGEVYMIVTERELVARRLKSVDDKIIFRCDNPAYDDLSLDKKQVIELWHADAYFSYKLIAPTRMEERMGQLESKLSRIESMLNKN
ncbi:S24 family peptidase, partial [Fulvivirga aurantia]|uniref:S24 family peptidase n=1 Tax=Fulvivirga aurantia TaxID=2529383 RepID=UPI0016277935